LANGIFAICFIRISAITTRFAFVLARGWTLAAEVRAAGHLHGDDDQIVPIADSAMLSAKLVKNAELKIYKGAPHGMCTTEKDKVNQDLLAFIERKEAQRAA
jgi:pimeloyl-ACP methyl ester carboxylesterase